MTKSIIKSSIILILISLLFTSCSINNVSDWDKRISFMIFISVIIWSLYIIGDRLDKIYNVLISFNFDTDNIDEIVNNTKHLSDIKDNTDKIDEIVTNTENLTELDTISNKLTNIDDNISDIKDQ